MLKTGKIETGGEFIDKEIIRAERNSGVVNNKLREIQRIRTYLVLANARASPKFDPLLKRFDESFINENAIKSTFGIFNKKQPLCVDTRKQSV
ncbi:hypothetical protein RYX36_019165 [Vicia faba]